MLSNVMADNTDYRYGNTLKNMELKNVCEIKNNFKKLNYKTLTHQFN